MAYLWVQANATALNGDKTQIGLVGDSAGGNLVVRLAHELESHMAPIKAIALIYPVIIDNSITSKNRNPLINFGRILLKSLLTYCFGNLEAANKIFMACNLLQNTTYPKIMLMAAEKDPLTEAIQNYANALTMRGASVEYKYYAGTIHGFFNFTKYSSKAKKALGDLVGFLIATLHSR